MSKEVLNPFAEIAIKQSSKISAVHSPGSRVLPSREKRNDERLGMRIDAGNVIDGKKSLVLQVNREATATVLKDWLKANGSHTKLAETTFDTNSADPKEEEIRAIEELIAKAKANLG